MKKSTFILCLFFALTSFVQGQKHATILWDASFSMSEKNLEKELQLLEAITSSGTYNTIDLVVFAHEILEKKTYDLSGSGLDNLKADLKNIWYDGETTFPEIILNPNTSLVICFSDGSFISGKMNATYDSAYLINSLQFDSSSMATSKNPFYINLHRAEVSIVKKLIEGSMDRGAFSEKYQVVAAANKKKEIRVYGYTYTKEGYLNEVKIESLSNKEKTVVSEDNGTYEILIPRGDILKFTTKQGLSKTIKVTSEEDVQINLEFGDDVNKLDEVVVTKKKAKAPKVLGVDSEETRKLGYAVVQVNADQKSDAETTVGEMLAANTPGVQFKAKNDLGSAIIRGYSSIEGNNHPLMFIDGVPIKSSSRDEKAITDFIEPNNVANIKVLKGLAATSIYGPEATNGVIIITTKNGFSGASGGKKRGNVYKKKLKVAKEDDTYKALEKTLSAGGTVDEAYKLYLKQRFLNESDMVFYFNAFDYFDKKGDFKKALRIISNIKELYNDSPDQMLALAFKYEEKRFNKRALAIYKRLAELRPESIQYQRNLAVSLNANKKVDESIAIYEALLSGENIDAIPEPLKKVLHTEVKHLYTKNNTKFTNVNISPYLKQNAYLDGRVVFEWTDPTAEFELQFVNPDKLFYNWSHTKDEDDKRLEEELAKGYHMEEFQLVDAEKGDWFFNVLKSEDTTNEEGTFIKLTMYKNYGKPNESIVVRVVPLNFTGKEKTIARIRI